MHKDRIEKCALLVFEWQKGERLNNEEEKNEKEKRVVWLQKSSLDIFVLASREIAHAYYNDDDGCRGEQKILLFIGGYLEIPYR
jgi:hypothetical protein